MNMLDLDGQIKFFWGEHMSKAVLISIKPKWCELIASGKKTVEVRKTKPKLETPFKVYIYCTDPRHYVDKYHCYSFPENPLWLTKNGVKTSIGSTDEEPIMLNGKVIGEFVCDKIFPISVYYDNPNSELALKEFPYVCLTDKQIIDYLGNGKQGYGWHISDLVIYDNPKELSEFKKINRDCWYADLGLAKRDCPECKNKECFMSKPPQSWCYVEELSV